MAEEQVIMSETAQQIVLPKSEFDPLDPVPGAIYDDELYAQRQSNVKGDEQSTTINTPTSNTDATAGANTAPATTESPTVETPAPTFDYDAFVKEKTGGKFEKWEDLQKKIEQTEPVYNETSKQFIDYINAGKEEELTLFLNQRRVLAGIETMDAESLIKLNMRINDPDLSAEDVELDFVDKYGDKPDPETITDPEEYRKALRRYNRAVSQDSQAAKEGLTKLKSEIKLQPLAEKQPEITRESLEAETAEYGKSISDSVGKSLKDFTSLKFSFEDKNNGVQFDYDFAVPEQDKAELQTFMADFFSSFETRYKAKGGEFDGSKLAKDFYTILHGDKIIKSAVMSALNKGVRQTAESIANVNLSQQSNPAIDFAADNRKKAIEDFIEA